MSGHGEQIGQDESENRLQGSPAKDTPADSSESSRQAAGDVSLEAHEIETHMKDEASAAAENDDSAPDVSAKDTSPEIGQSDIELLLNKAQQALSSIDEDGQPLPTGAQRFEFQNFVGTPASSESATLELMQDVELDLKIELGRTYMRLEDVLRLGKGAVVTLDKLAGDPVDIFVNGRLIARGEVLVLNDNFCVRVAELVVGEAA